MSGEIHLVSIKSIVDWFSSHDPWILLSFLIASLCQNCILTAKCLTLKPLYFIVLFNKIIVIVVYLATNWRGWRRPWGSFSSPVCWFICSGTISGSVQVGSSCSPPTVFRCSPQQMRSCYAPDVWLGLFANRSSLTCPQCQKQSNTFDPFLCISLPIPLPQTRWVLQPGARWFRQTLGLFWVSIIIHFM